MEIRIAPDAQDKTTLDPQTLQELAAHRDRACLSLFVPLDGTEPAKAHRTRFENLVDDARAALVERVSSAEADELMRSVRTLFAQVERDAGASLAVFADTSGPVRWCYLPWEVGPQWSVSERFTLKHLAPADAEDAFVIVALSQDRVRVFRADRTAIDEQDPEELPHHGVADIPGADAETNRLQMHSGKQSRGPRGGMNEAIFHGHRDDTRGEDELVARLCRQTAEALRKSLSDRETPIVIAAVGRLAATFRQHAPWANVVDVVEGNPDQATPEDLHRAALAPFRRHLESRMAKHAEQLGDAIHHGRGSDDVSSIVVAAYDGRVDTLFVDRNAVRWGRLEAADRKVVVHDEPKPSDDDLVDRAISDTLARGGTVVSFVPSQVDVMAALYRHG